MVNKNGLYLSIIMLGKMQSINKSILKNKNSGKKISFFEFVIFYILKYSPFTLYLQIYYIPSDGQLTKFQPTFPPNYPNQTAPLNHARPHLHKCPTTCSEWWQRDGLLTIHRDVNTEFSFDGDGVGGWRGGWLEDLLNEFGLLVTTHFHRSTT